MMDHKKDLRRTFILTISILAALMALKYIEARYGILTRWIS